MIRFSAFLVAVALGLLVAGVVTSRLMLVYVAIGVSGVALLALGVGMLIKRKELFGKQAPAEPELARPEPAAVRVPTGQPQPQLAPWEAEVPAASAWAPLPSAPAAAAQPAPSRAGYLPAEQPLPPPPPRPQPIQPQPIQPQPIQPQPVQAQPADVAAAAWGSGFPAPPERPGPAERPADVPRRPAAFTPRPPSGPPSPAPGIPAPPPGTWEWRGDAPATQPLREVPRPASAPAPVSPLPPAAPAPPAQDQPSREQDPPAETVPPAGDQHEADRLPDEQTRHPAAAADTAAETAPAPPEAPPSSSSAPEPAASAPVPASVMPEPEPATAQPASAPADLDGEVTVVPGVPRYHNSNCLLIRFMGEGDLEKMTLGAAREAGCTPCRACLPERADEHPS